MNTSRLQPAGKPPSGSVPQVQWQNQQSQHSQQNQSQSQQSHQQSQHQQQPQQGSYYSSANYSLPGVINYLTSEFTNLERFKIMTNLEKSEMKYKIIQLQCEVNSLKIVGEKQKTRIENLEQENRQLREQLTGKTDSSTPSEEDKLSSEVPEIPDVDLSVIKKSRSQLTKYMKEIVHLLKVPSVKNTNYLGIPEISDHSLNNELDALVHNDDNFNDNFDFNDHNILNSPKSLKKSKTVTSKYFSDNAESPDAFVDFDEIKKANVDFFDEKQFTGSQTVTNDSKGSQYDSDAETEILDHVDEVAAPLDKKSLNGEEKYAFQQVFEEGDTQVHLTSISDEYRIEVFDKSAKKKVFSKDVFFNTMEPDRLISLHRIALEDSKGTFVAVQDNGVVFGLTVETEKTNESELIDLKSLKVHIESSGLTELPHSEKTRRFGFVINSLGENFLIKTYQLLLKEGRLEAKEIGSFNRNFIAKSTSSEHITFENWAFNSNAQAGPCTPKKKRGKGDAAGSVEDEESTFLPHELVYKADDKQIKINVVNKTVHP